MKKNYFLAAILSFAMVSMNAQFTDDMESYTDGQPISEGHWTDWGCGGGAGCAIMSSSAQAHGGTLSGLIPGDGTTDAVLDLGSKIFSQWGLSFWMYVPADKEAYFNLQNDIPVGTGSWIVGDIHFNHELAAPGVGKITDSALGEVLFDFPHDQWFRVVMNWNIENGISLSTWQFNVAGVDVLPTGTAFTSADGTLATALGGFDLYSISANNLYYVDSFEYIEGTIVLGAQDFDTKGFDAFKDSNNILNVKANETINNVAIYNMLGQVVYSANVNATQSTIDMSSFANGTYIVKVNINGTEGSIKVIR